MPPAAPRRQAAAATALLIDLPALEAEARAQQGEVAMQRLRQGLAGSRGVAGAVAVTHERGPVPKGFETLRGEDSLSFGIQLAATAFRMAADGACLVLAPATPALRELARVLRTAGHKVELAGFTAGDDVRALGRDCLFVP